MRLYCIAELCSMEIEGFRPLEDHLGNSMLIDGYHSTEEGSILGAKAWLKELMTVAYRLKTEGRYDHTEKWAIYQTM
jgi:hypothetical protein